MANIFNGRNAGKEVGYKSFNSSGKQYVLFTIKGATTKLHRMIWLYVHGELPVFIDHINGDGTDNRLINLRSVSRIENNKNRRLNENNTSGACGVNKRNDCRGYFVTIKVKGNAIYLGAFDNLDEAISARKDAELKYGFHENHGQERGL